MKVKVKGHRMELDRERIDAEGSKGMSHNDEETGLNCIFDR